MFPTDDRMFAAWIIMTARNLIYQ